MSTISGQSSARLVYHASPSCANSRVQIVVSLSPYLNIPSCTEKVKQIFNYLIVEQRQHLRKFFKEVPHILPDIPALAEIRQVLTEETGKVELNQRLAQLISGIEHESANVQFMALKELLNLLQSQRTEVLCCIESVCVCGWAIIAFLLSG